MRLIDADIFIVAIEFVKKHLFVGDSEFLQGYEAGLRGAVNSINEIPTVDAVEVVRCKDCKYRHSTYTGKNYFCNLWDSRDSVKDSDFCSYGERRSDV